MDKNKIMPIFVTETTDMASILKPENPFFTVIQIPDKYFCDREQETRAIINLIMNGNNVVMKAQRRIGKSSLIHHIFNQEPIKTSYNTLYVDIFGTKNLDDFHLTFQNSLLHAPFAKSAKIKSRFEMLLSNMSLSLGEYNPVTGTYSLPRIGTTPSLVPRISMAELFEFLENTPRPNLVVFDEFQQIQYYPERMAAILRSFTQKMNNTKFIYSGSSRHMLTVMFQMASQPFYKSAEPYDIKALPLDTYTVFCQDLFAQYEKGINPEAVTLLYQLFSGETAPMQETMNRVFSNTPVHQSASPESIRIAINELLDSRDTSYREVLNRLERENTRNTLYSIAAMGIATNLTSSKTIKYYHLDNASSVQKSLLKLQDEYSPLIKKIAKGTYVIDDRLFELWMAREGNYLDTKFALAESRFLRQNELENPIFHPIAPDIIDF